LIRNALVVLAAASIRRTNIFGTVSLSGKSGFQTFLTFQSDPVRSKPYPHDHSSRQIRQPVVQRVCQFPSPHANGKSLKVKDAEEKAGDTPLQRRFVRDDLDVSVKASP